MINPFRHVTREELLLMLPVVVADLKHADTPKSRRITNENIRREMYAHAVRELFTEERFKHIEREPNGQQGLFIKGYVRDIWAYLDEAYALVHSINFMLYADMTYGDIVESLAAQAMAENIQKVVDDEILMELIKQSK